HTVYWDFAVKALDPFGYPTTGNLQYPRTFTVSIDGCDAIQLAAHIWPAKSNLEQYKGIGSVIERQGFYFYRNDRLVQAGGWNGFRQPEHHLSLARVAVDLPADL